MKASLILLWLVSAFALNAAELPGEWTGPYRPCVRHSDLLKPDHLSLGIRFSTSNQTLAVQFAQAMDFWTAILDMEWHVDNSANCAIQILDGETGLFGNAEIARAQFPGTTVFQGWIAFNPKISLPQDDQFLVAIHELGHMFGLTHNPSAWSVMYYLHLDGPLLLEPADLTALAAHHKLRMSYTDIPIVIPLTCHDCQSLGPPDVRRQNMEADQQNPYGKQQRDPRPTRDR